MGEDCNMKLTIPKSCMSCPLRGGITRKCGKVVVNKASSAGSQVSKVPDESCLLKGVEIPERLYKAMIEYGTRF